MTAFRATGLLGLASLCGLVALAGCSSAPELPLVPTSRVVLAEFFTWQRCSYCPYAAHTLDSLTREFDDSLVVVAYHRRVAGDTLSPNYVEARRAYYYDSGGEPATVFDGGPPVRTAGPEYNYPTFRSHILAARSVLPRVQLSLDGSLDSLAGTVRVSVSGVDSTPAETLQLFVVLVEDCVPSTLAGATDTLFDDVMRAMLPGPEGRPIELARRDTLRFEYQFAVLPGWNPGRLSAVAFVQQVSNRSVLQTAAFQLADKKGDED